MKTKIIPLIGDPIENLYQLGLGEREAFLKLEARVMMLLSTNPVLRYGQDIVSRARVLLKKKEESFFNRCINSYAEGLGIEPVRYFSFLSLFEVAAHYGQTYPELKGLLPGCTSVLDKQGRNITHTRLLDFPLLGIFNESPRLYYWRPEGKEAVLNYSCEGMAPLFLQGLHGGGVSFALHHKPGKAFHREGQSIFQIAFESLFEGNQLSEIKKEIRKRVSVTKWSFIFLDKGGQVLALDIDGPAQNLESYNVNETTPLIFTNIPLQQDQNGHEGFIKFSEDRQNWTKEKLSKNGNHHILDLLTDVKDQKVKNWKHPSATLSTIGAYHVNLSEGYLDVKESDEVLTSSDEIVRFSLENQSEPVIIKKQDPPDSFEVAWKRAAKAQSAFDQGKYDEAYHELQMARTLMPHPLWKNVFSFYQFVWDFKFVSNAKELSIIYKNVKTLEVPETLKDHWIMFIMRLEKRLDLSPTVTFRDVSPYMQELFQQEKAANKALFATWMKLIYPRLEILDIFSPHHK
ncbi:MAG: hypothetical protein ACLGHN_00595 [Bacteriovoracia bacterium]